MHVKYFLEFLERLRRLVGLFMIVSVGVFQKVIVSVEPQAPEEKEEEDA